MTKLLQFNRFAKYAWVVVGANLVVILWGAYVRATGSGAGCGNHWPLCNGQILPRLPQIETIIEFTHRLSSGLAFILVLGLFIWAFRRYPKGHMVRLGASLSLIFIITEALVGAGLVLFEWVAADTSTGRVISMGVHLINTFLLLGSVTLTAWWASGGEAIRLKGQGWLVWVFLIGLLGVLILGISGAITALGDTLFPVTTLAEGLSQDLSPTAHIAIRLRVWHPVVALSVGAYLILVSGLTAMFAQDEIRQNLAASSQENQHHRAAYYAQRNFSLALVGLVILQWLAGFINLLLLAPVWMQLLHLLLADFVWIILVLLSAVTLGSAATALREKPAGQVTADENSNADLGAALSRRIDYGGD